MVAVVSRSKAVLRTGPEPAVHEPPQGPGSVMNRRGRGRRGLRPGQPLIGLRRQRRQRAFQGRGLPVLSGQEMGDRQVQPEVVRKPPRRTRKGPLGEGTGGEARAHCGGQAPEVGQGFRRPPGAKLHAQPLPSHGDRRVRSAAAEPPESLLQEGGLDLGKPGGIRGLLPEEGIFRMTREGLQGERRRR